MYLLKLIKHWPPHRVFLADSIGAFSTAAILGLALVRASAHFGIRQSTFYLLATIALALMGYSLTNFLIRPRNPTIFLRGIALGNLTYIPITFYFLLFIETSPSALAFTYFTLEAVVIASIAYAEWKYADFYEQSRKAENSPPQINQSSLK